MRCCSGCENIMRILGPNIEEREAGEYLELYNLYCSLNFF
jgi:hypothetical protein